MFLENLIWSERQIFYFSFNKAKSVKVFLRVHTGPGGRGTSQVLTAEIRPRTRPLLQGRLGATSRAVAVAPLGPISPQPCRVICEGSQAPP